ncbi:MAG: hypothetical protein ACFFDF_15840 [Candidatus Odinarchaeota archaeon]
MTSIFQIDWITVDIIIIILLLILLFSVKIFKITHRWRNSFSNQALINKYFIQRDEKKKNKTIFFKKSYLTRNSKTNSNLPLILILQTNNKGKMLRIFTEGLSSYGFSIINIKAKIKHKLNNKILKNYLIEEWKSLISNLFNNFKIDENIKLNIILITNSKSVSSYKHILSYPNLKSVILINPRLNKKISSDYNEIFKNHTMKSQLFIIFSGKSYLIFKNKKIQKFYRIFAPQKNNFIKPLTVEKAHYSFKYYETINLGIIIDLIENKLLK